MMNLLRPIWTISWKIMVFFLWMSLLFIFLVPVAQALDKPEFRQSRLVRLCFEFIGTTIVLAVAWCMLRFMDHRPFRTFGFALNHAVRDSVIGFSLGAGLIFLTVATLWLGGWVHATANVTFVGSSLILTALALFLSSITQEAIFRGYIFQTIQSQSNATIALFVSAIIFAAFHAGSIGGELLPALNLFVGGLVYGLAYLLRGNLWLPIGIHFGWNVLQGPVFGLPVSRQSLDSGWQLRSVQGPPVMTGGTFGVEGDSSLY